MKDDFAECMKGFIDEIEQFVEETVVQDNHEFNNFLKLRLLFDKAAEYANDTGLIAHAFGIEDNEEAISITVINPVPSKGLDANSL